LLLRALSVCNFRCFDALTDLPFEGITAFIGPNDSGKSSILLLLQRCLRNEPIPASDFRDESQPIVVELRFEVMRAHEAEKAQPFLFSTNDLRVKKEFYPERRPTTWIYKDCYADDRLNRLAQLPLVDLNALMNEFNIQPRPRSNAERARAIQAHIELNPPYRQEAWSQASPELDDVLPEYIVFGADEDLTLQAGPLVTTLRQVYKSFLQDEQPEEVRQLLERANDKLQEVIGAIAPSIQLFAGDGVELVVRPSLELANSLNLGEVLVRAATGEDRRFASFGDGTKRRIMLGLFHWSNNVLSKVLQEEARSLLWGFDEPDTHLHYQAQYDQLGNIKSLADEGMQVLICTHSMPMIDQLPPTAVRQMVLDQLHGRTDIDYLRTEVIEEEDIADFLQGVGQSVGFSNSLLFYERCFVLVEGPTEAKALPVLYRALHGAEPLSHGIRVFAGESDGAVLMLARLLHHNRKEVVVLLDRDAEGKNLTQLDKLQEGGFDVAHRVMYIGVREFEDAFDNEALCLCLNAYYQRTDGVLWAAEHIDPFRYTNGAQNVKKFSHEFVEVAVSKAANKRVSKPEFGRKLAEQLMDERLIPVEIKQLFDFVRQIACTT